MTKAEKVADDGHTEEQIKTIKRKVKKNGFSDNKFRNDLKSPKRNKSNDIKQCQKQP